MSTELVQMTLSESKPQWYAPTGRFYESIQRNYSLKYWSRKRKQKKMRKPAVCFRKTVQHSRMDGNGSKHTVYLLPKTPQHCTHGNLRNYFLHRPTLQTRLQTSRRTLQKLLKTSRISSTFTLTASRRTKMTCCNWAWISLFHPKRFQRKK